MVLSFLFFGFLAYLIFKLVVNFVIPIYRTTKQMKEKFREMNEQMQGGTPRPHRPRPTEPQSKRPKHPSGDYIDFEEIKNQNN